MKDWMERAKFTVAHWDACRCKYCKPHMRKNKRQIIQQARSFMNREQRKIIEEET